MKDEIAVEVVIRFPSLIFQGVLCCEGSPLLTSNIATTSANVIKKLEENGAIIVGKTNQPEFAAGSNTFNEVFGSTKNPWDLTKSAGGSSGGSAAAIAAGEGWIALGTDLGGMALPENLQKHSSVVRSTILGSLRIPASFCSVVGFRTSPGRVIEDDLPNGKEYVKYKNSVTLGA